MKRAFDLLLVLGTSWLWVPLVGLLAIVVRRKLGAPVFFRQPRPGRHGVPFMIFKFRTMLETKDADGNFLPDAERLTPFGRFLRGSSLDELPELFNVLRGEMSLVGPRPLRMGYLPLYTPDQARRHEVRPGITGWAQVNGRNSITWEEKFRFDVWYVDHLTLVMDIFILLLTVWKVISRNGIDSEPNISMPPFRGSSPL